MIKINLPKPLSTNTLFKNKKQGRVRTEDYNAWLWHAKAMIQKQKPLPFIDYPVRLHFLVGEEGVSPGMDGDNTLKALQDSLVSNNILADDNRKIVRSVGMEWIPGMEGATAYIFPVSERLSEVEVVGVIS